MDVLTILDMAQHLHIFLFQVRPLTLLSSLLYSAVYFVKGVTKIDHDYKKLVSHISRGMWEILLMLSGLFKEYKVSLIFLKINLLSLSTTSF